MSKKNVSGFVSALGALLDFVIRLMAAFTKLGGTDEQFHELITGKKSEEFITKASRSAMEMVCQAKATFPVFKTITLGLYDSVKAYRKALEHAGFRIGDWASDILNNIKVSQNQIQMDLVRVSGADLGFKEAVRYDRICARAKELGLELCPAEVGPALRLAYPDQPYGEWFRIAMELITGADGSLKIFGVVRGSGGRWLNGYDGNPGPPWTPASVWVFVLPRK